MEEVNRAELVVQYADEFIFTKLSLGYTIEELFDVKLADVHNYKHVFELFQINTHLITWILYVFGVNLLYFERLWLVFDLRRGSCLNT